METQQSEIAGAHPLPPDERALRRAVEVKHRSGEQQAEQHSEAHLAALRRIAAERAARVLKQMHADTAQSSPEQAKKRQAQADRAAAKARRRAEVYALNAILRAKFEVNFAAFAESKMRENDTNLSNQRATGAV